MLRPGADLSNVQMTDVLCDFCHRVWAEDVPFIEGHRNAIICGHCLRVAYVELVLKGRENDQAGAGGAAQAERDGFTCILCRESPKDREAEGRPDEPGWRSPIEAETAVCRRCVKRAAGVLHKDPDYDWRKPVSSSSGSPSDSDDS